MHKLSTYTNTQKPLIKLYDDFINQLQINQKSALHNNIFINLTNLSFLSQIMLKHELAPYTHYKIYLRILQSFASTHTHILIIKHKMIFEFKND